MPGDEHIDPSVSPEEETSAKGEYDRGAGVAQSLPVESITGRISTLHEIVLQIDAAGSRDEILRVLHHEVRWIIQHHFCFACLVDKFHTHYAVTSLSPLNDSILLEGRKFPVSHGVSGTVIQNQ